MIRQQNLSCQSLFDCSKSSIMMENCTFGDCTLGIIGPAILQKDSGLLHILVSK